MEKAGEKMEETVYFSITGEFVTNMARDWLYAENRPYEKVVDFLLSAMEGTGLDRKTLVGYANDILAGKRKMVGDTRDGSYGLVDDDTDIIEEYSYWFKNRPAEKYAVEKRDDEDSSFAGAMRNIRSYNNRLKSCAVKVGPVTEDYGWLRPDGKFFGVSWGKHESWAIEYTEKHYPGRNICYAGDFLKERGWLLLHNPCGGSYISIPVGDIQSSTKRQKEFLYDYFLKRGRTSDANLIWRVEE